MERSKAIEEFKAAGWMDEDGNVECEMQREVCNCLLALLTTFSNQGHSGSSAPYVLNLFQKLASHEALTPLTGEDSEWIDVDNGMFQNKRESSVFYYTETGEAMWIDGKVFWEWATHVDIDDGKPFKTHFTSSDSRVLVQFPWSKPESEEVFVPSEAFPTEELNDDEH
jgi:hypothetical protein